MMNNNNRKDDHLKLAFRQRVKANSFDKILLEGTDLPDLAINDIDLSTTFLGNKVSYPIYINAMTGGSKKAYKVNQYLSKLVSYFNFPMITGSQSIAIKDPKHEDSFKVIRKNYQGILLGNLNPNYGLEDAKKAVEMINADGLSIHLNLVQELAMDEGDRDFTKWSSNIQEIVKGLNDKVLVKQVGLGLSLKTITKLKSLGVKYIDVSGSGGTSFLSIESKRSRRNYNYLNSFSIDTADILLKLKDQKDLEIYASGGIRNPLDVVKALILGADAVGLSRWFLNLTKYPLERSIRIVVDFLNDIKKIMLVLGVKNIEELKEVKYTFKQ